MIAQSLFSKIDGLDEVRSIFKEAASASATVLGKFPRRDLVQFQMLRYTPSHTIVFDNIEASQELPSKAERVLFTFKVLGDKYYFQGNINKLNNGFSVRPFELYKLHRREAYRIRVPISYRAGIEIQSFNGKACRVPSLVYDISNVGCRLIVPMDVFAPFTDAKIKGVFAQASQDNFPIAAEIRHFSPDPFVSDAWSVGLRFVDMPPAIENKLAGFSMDLHRTIFARWKN